MALRSIAFASALVCALAACGQPQRIQSETPANQGFTQVASWTGLVDGVTVTPQGDGSTTVAASNSSPGYQVDYVVPTNGASTILLRYDISLQGGPGFIGVLAGDGSRWLNNFDLPANQRSQGDAAIAVNGDTVRIVIQTAPTSAANTTFTVHSAEYLLQ